MGDEVVREPEIEGEAIAPRPARANVRLRSSITHRKKDLARGVPDELDLNHFSWLKSLPERTTSLVELRTLDLRYCSELLELPEEIGMLTRLVRLDLSWV